VTDWSLFDQTIAQGNGPYRGLFEAVLRQTDPLATGVPFLDHYLEGGLHPGLLNVISGRTSHGKTLLARTVIQRHREKRILYIHADEDRTAVAIDLAASALKRRNYEVKADLKHPAGITPAALEKTLLDTYPQLHIPEVDMLGAGIEDVASVVDQAERMWGAPAELIVFDYMGCLNIEGGDTNVLGLIHTRAHKTLCRMFDQSVWLVLSQLRRPQGKLIVPSLDQMFGGGEAAIDGCAIGVWRWEERAVDDVHIMLNIMKAKQGRAYLGGPAKRDKVGDNPLNNPHVHQITPASTIYPKPYPTVEVVHGQ